MGRSSLLLGIGYALGAILLALIVVVPIFWVLNLIYTGPNGLVLLLVVVVVAWAALAWFLRRRRFSL